MIVEVHGLLRQPQVQNTSVEVHILLWIIGDGGYVVYSRKLYTCGLVALLLIFLYAETAATAVWRI
jgi:hypothetical protein